MLLYPFQLHRQISAIFTLGALFFLTPVVGDTTSQYAYNLDDHPELSHLNLRLQGIIDKNKNEFTEINHYVPYVDKEAAVSTVCYTMMTLFSFPILRFSLLELFNWYKNGGNFPRATIAYIIAILLIAWWAKKNYDWYANPGGIFLTDTGLLLVEPGHGLGEWIPYDNIKDFKLHEILANMLVIEIVEDFAFCYLNDIEPQSKVKEIIIKSHNLGGDPAFYTFYKLFKTKWATLRVDLMTHKKENNTAKAKQQLLERQDHHNEPFHMEEQITMPAPLELKVQTILEKSTQASTTPLFNQIKHYAPYRSFSFDYFLIPLSLLATNIGLLLAAYYKPFPYHIHAAVIGTMCLLPTTISFAIKSYHHYYNNKSPGGWFLTDIGSLLIEPGPEIQYRFFPYKDIVNISPDPTGRKQVTIVANTFPSYDIKASDMMSAQVFDNFVERLQIEVVTVQLKTEKEVTSLQGRDIG